jgi:hypothetical protein
MMVRILTYVDWMRTRGGRALIVLLVPVESISPERLAGWGHLPRAFDTGADLLAALRAAGEPALVLVPRRMPDTDAAALAAEASAALPVPSSI